MNYYLILGVPRDADEQTIRSAYRALARQFHPDAGEGSSPERFRLIAEAYETLGDPERRKAYDETLRPSRPRFVPVEPVVPVEPAYAPWRRPLDFDRMWDELWRALEEQLGYGRRFL
ncbi:MAG: J domain-containing protein [Bryobacterales bacterium]|nr:J domain-containing protein [Bryobacterales bacterium]